MKDEFIERLLELHKKYESEYYSYVEMDDGNPFRSYLNLYDSALFRIDYLISTKEILIASYLVDESFIFQLDYEVLILHYQNDTLMMYIHKLLNAFITLSKSVSLLKGDVKLYDRYDKYKEMLR